MPTKPTAKNINGASAGMIVQAIINADKSGYFAGAPAVNNTTDSIRMIGSYILASQNRRNQFVDTLMNKIAFSIFSSFVFYDKWSQYTEKGILDDGETIEEIYVGLTKAENYEWTTDTNATVKKLLGKRENDVSTAYHSINYEKQYVKTITKNRLRRAFKSVASFDEFVHELISSMFKSYAYDNYIMTKYMLYRLALDGKIYNLQVPDIDTSANKKEAIEIITAEIKSTLNDMSFIRSDYNMAHVETSMEPSMALIARTPRLTAYTDVFVLSEAFNMDKADYSNRQLLIDGFTTSELTRLDDLLSSDTSYVPFTDDELSKIKQIVGIVLDENLFKNYMEVYEMSSIYVPSESYWNYFLNVTKVYSASPFKNVIMLTSMTDSVNSVTVSPATANAYPGNTVAFTATVTTDGFASKDIKWSISGSESTDTYIDYSGVVHVANEVDGTEIVVTATSTFDNSVKGTATLTVSA